MTKERVLEGKKMNEQINVPPPDSEVESERIAVLPIIVVGLIGLICIISGVGLFVLDAMLIYKTITLSKDITSDLFVIFTIISLIMLFFLTVGYRLFVFLIFDVECSLLPRVTYRILGSIFAALAVFFFVFYVMGKTNTMEFGGPLFISMLCFFAAREE